METDALKAVQADLAEKFWVPYHIDPVSPRECDEACPCDMTHRRYLFRLACPDFMCKVGQHPAPIAGPRMASLTCPHCQGLSYIFNADPDVLWDAVRAKEWSIQITAWGPIESDQVLVWFNPDDQAKLRAEVQISEGLRGQAALQTALHRAMEAE